MAAQAPTAQGLLRRTPFVELAIYFAKRRLSGTLVLEERQLGKSGITFYGGVACKIQVPETNLLLGNYLIRAGISASAVHEALHDSKPDPLGQKLVQHGVIGYDDLSAALFAQFADKLVWLTTLPLDTAFAFYERTDFLAPWPRAVESQDPLPWIWRASKELDRERITQVLEGLGDRPLRLHAKAQPGRFTFGKELDSVLDVLRAKPYTYSEICAASLVEGRLLERMLYVLVMCQHLDWGDQQAFPLGVARVAETRLEGPRSSGRVQPVSSTRLGSRELPVISSLPASAPESATASAVLELAKRLDSLTLYDVLQLPRTASEEAATEAFLALAKKWHPDRIATTNPQVRDAATRVFARMSDAHHTLSHAERRKAYDQTLTKVGDDDQDKVLKVLAAARAFQKAEILARKRDFKGALQLGREAHETDPDQVDYKAFVAWVQAQTSSFRESGDYAELLDVLKDAVQREPNSLKIHLYRAQVLSRAGQIEKAIREYRWIVRHDRNNIEAARELRLLKMRQDREAASSPNSMRSSRLFSKLLKR